jgi:hypothetical protein
MNMKAYRQTRKMEFAEQVLRGGVGMIMLETVLLTPALTPVLIAGLSLAALYMVFTAIIGQDPFYSLGYWLLQRGKRVKASVTPYPARNQVSVTHDRKKAA